MGTTRKCLKIINSTGLCALGHLIYTFGEVFDRIYSTTPITLSCEKVIQWVDKFDSCEGHSYQPPEGKAY